MRKIVALILASLLSLSMFCGCNSSTTTPQETTPPTDEDFVSNLGKGLTARWTLTNSDSYNDDALDTASLSERNKAYNLFVNAELDTIGNLSDYQFKNDEVKTLAETYMKGLDLQKEGVSYIASSDYSTNYTQTWELGSCYRTVAITELYNNYGLTVDEKYQSTLNDFIAQNEDAKKQIAIQEFVDELPDKLYYTKDEENSDEWYTYYEAVVENTTAYTIDSLEIDIDFLDASGIVIAQDSDYLENLQPGTKLRSKLFYDNSEGAFKSMQYHISAYHE